MEVSMESSSTTTGSLSVKRVALELSDATNIEPIDLEFRSLSYSVPLGFCKGEKTILKDVCGKFQPGQLIAIMGPSGAGKSSLLDVLSGYRMSGMSGAVYTNGAERDLATFRKLSCYIMQEDRLQSLLTVSETMALAADLKLANKVARKEKKRIIDDILSTLGLSENKTTRAASLSGGEKKRLSIALELINNPLIMFLDEPTTGLDSLACHQCISLLKNLALQGRTIVCTIHQPSATIFQMFDHVYVLAEGQCVYQGSAERLVPFLSSVDLQCPIYNNPADFVLEATCGEYGDHNDKMVAASGNGRSTKWFSGADALPEFITEDNSKSNSMQVMKKRYVMMKALCPSFLFCGSRNRGGVKQETSEWTQFLVLLKRGFIKMGRDTTLTHGRIMVNLSVGLLLGLMFFGIGNDGARILDNYNFLFSILVHLMFSTMMLTILTFPLEMNILVKEHFNRWYTLKSYYLAASVVDIPILTLSCTIFIVLVYGLSFQPIEYTRFSMFFLISLLVTYVAHSFGLVIGAIANVVNGTFLGPAISVPVMMMSGFGVAVRDMPYYMRWGTWTSYLRYALEGFIVSIYGERETLDCSKMYCHFQYPEKFLREIDMANAIYWVDIVGLVVILFILRSFAYVMLRWRLFSAR